MPRLSAILLNRERARLKAPAVVPQASGVDLVCSTVGLHVSYRVDAAGPVYQVWVQCSTDAGLTYGQRVQVSASGASDAVPTLAVTRNDDLFCWHHDLGGVMDSQISSDYGATFAHWDAGPPAGKFPRMAIQIERWLLAFHDGDELQVWGTVPGTKFSTDGALLSVLSMPAQLVELDVDRYQMLHLLYVDNAGDLRSRYSGDGATWTPAASGAGTLVASGVSMPGAAYGVEGGPILGWVGADTKGYVTDTDYVGIVAGPVADAFGLTAQTLGVGVDRYDTAWAVGQTSGASMKTFYSRDFAAWTQRS